MDKKLAWYTIGLMGFSAVWGFGNITGGFVYFNGISVISSWLLLFIFYFIPYALMVGELGSAFKTANGGVSSWINETKGKKLAYYAGWTYWACHVTYIAAKGSNCLKSLSWAIFRNAEKYDSFPTFLVQLATLAVLILSCCIALKGLNILKKLLTIAGTSTFVLSILYILMIFAFPNSSLAYKSFTFKDLLPNFNLTYFSSLSILVFAVGGCEKVSPYVNKSKNPGKDFPLGMITLATMVVICAVLGTVAMSRMFDPEIINSSPQVFNSYVANCNYWAFQKLGQMYKVGNFFLIVYAVAEAVVNFSVLVLSIDAPLRMLLGNEAASEFIPQRLKKVNKNGVYVNGIKMVLILSGTLVMVQSFGAGAADVIAQLRKLNSICMPMRYLWVFIAYISLKSMKDSQEPEYVFVKNKTAGKIAGCWCFAITAFCCLTGIYDKNPSTMILNIATPIILTALGVILPLIAKRNR